jgi:hypothetical protein
MRAQLHFNPTEHRYWIGPPGQHREVINVTRVLEHFNEEMRAARACNPEAFEYATELGQAVHRACELEDKGHTIQADTLDDAVALRLAQWRKFKRDTGCVLNAIEERVYHPVHDYAGTLDRVMTFAGRRWLVDLKSGARSRFAQPQTGAYKLAWEAQDGAPIERRACLYLGPEDYHLEPHDGRNDSNTFISMLQTYRWLTTTRN